MAFARVAGFGSIGLAITLAVLLPDQQGAAYAALAGWAGAALVTLGVWFGERTPIVIGAVAFAAKVVIVSSLVGPLVPPVWIQTLMVVLIVESATLSVEARLRARPVASTLGRMAASALLAMVVSIGLESLVYGTSGSGIVLRVAAIAAAVFLGGWLTMTWRRATG